MPLEQRLRCERRAEVTVVLSHQLQNIITDADVEGVGCGTSTRLVDQRRAAAVLIPGQQTLRLPKTYVQHARGRLRRPPTGQHLGQNLDPLQVLFAHLYPAQSVASQSQLKGTHGDILALHSYDSFALLLHDSLDRRFIIGHIQGLTVRRLHVFSEPVASYQTTPKAISDQTVCGRIAFRSSTRSLRAALATLGRRSVLPSTVKDKAILDTPPN